MAVTDNFVNIVKGWESHSAWPCTETARGLDPMSGKALLIPGWMLLAVQLKGAALTCNLVFLRPVLIT